MWVRMSSQQPLGVVCAVTLPSSGPASARGGSRWLLSRVAVLGGAAPAPSAPSALEGSCGCSLAVLSPWPGGAASVPGPCLSLVALLSPCQVAQDAQGTRILLLPSSGILWDVQAQAAFP